MVSGWKVKAAKTDILSTQGKVMEKACLSVMVVPIRIVMGKVACWNSVMEENKYMVRKNEFIAS